jgi:hypothetical protein
MFKWQIWYSLPSIIQFRKFHRQHQCTLHLVRGHGVLLLCTGYSALYSEIALSRKPFGIRHMYIRWPLRIFSFSSWTPCIVSMIGRLINVEQLVEWELAGKPQQNLPLCQFIKRKYDTDLSEIEPVPPQWETDGKSSDKVVPIHISEDLVWRCFRKGEYKFTCKGIAVGQSTVLTLFSRRQEFARLSATSSVPQICMRCNGIKGPGITYTIYCT